MGKEDSEPRLEEYWNYGRHVFRSRDRRKPIRSRQEAVEHVRATLLDSTRKHLVGDVPIAAFLSGGVDSTSVVSMMRKAGQEKIATFSLGSERAGLDESPYSRLAAKTYGTIHHEWLLAADDFRRHRLDILDAMDQPTVDGVNTWFVSKFARDSGYKVVTSGTGGDEFFYGYDGTFDALPKAMSVLRRVPALFAPAMSTCLSAFSSRSPGLAKVSVMLADARDPSHCYDIFRGLFPRARIAGLFADGSMGEEAGSLRMTDFLPRPYSGKEADGIADRRLIKVLEVSRYLGCQLLPDSDNFSMCHSLELRLPLVDRRVSEALEEIDEACFDTARGEPKKSLLIDAVGDIPDSLVYRKKQGFTLPIDDWMRTYEWKPASGLLSEKACASIDAAFRCGKLHWSRRWALEALDHMIARG
jgi:asparagine synthase (glutamine-hydrolysing)